jgi:hypothetical protein
MQLEGFARRRRLVVLKHDLHPERDGHHSTNCGDKSFESRQHGLRHRSMAVADRTGVSMFPTELERRAFRAPDGEYGWTREDVRSIIPILAENQLAILGGELWWVLQGARTWTGLIQLRDGSTAVYHWSSDREPGEEWTAFVSRCAEESLAAVDRFPGDIDLPVDLSGLILYNLTWVSQDGYLDLQTRVRRQKSRSWLSRLLLANARRRRPR